MVYVKSTHTPRIANKSEKLWELWDYGPDVLRWAQTLGAAMWTQKAPAKMPGLWFLIWACGLFFNRVRFHVTFQTLA